MKIPREDTARTRGKLLAAAGEVFAGKGFRDATVAEICRRAGTNVAAVNYHFGSKESLYREAWRHAFVQSVEAHPPDGGVAAEAPAEERLRGQIFALLNRIADENNQEIRFMQREVMNPTGLLKEVMREALRPLQERTRNLVRELLGPKAVEQDAQFCEVGIISQCINPMVIRNRSRAEEGAQEGPPGIVDIEAYARHVVTFSLAGIAAVRAAAQARRKMGKAGLSRRGRRP
ncbi:MAG: CerR family C-terminal domain-containing protein [Deltaproteobacteria bacterium]|nr:CerR family C-terminal domain-containing protein [Deltaproteobacteria bacterium]